MPAVNAAGRTRKAAENRGGKPSGKGEADPEGKKEPVVGSVDNRATRLQSATLHPNPHKSAGGLPVDTLWILSGGPVLVGHWRPGYRCGGQTATVSGW
jgi:hypothetical protein